MKESWKQDSRTTCCMAYPPEYRMTYDISHPGLLNHSNFSQQRGVSALGTPYPKKNPPRMVLYVCRRVFLPPKRNSSGQQFAAPRRGKPSGSERWLASRDCPITSRTSSTHVQVSYPFRFRASFVQYNTRTREPRRRRGEKRLKNQCFPFTSFVHTHTLRPNHHVT